jgi:ATP-dependent exoDNAse (exonuclease V) alpha subunit
MSQPGSVRVLSGVAGAGKSRTLNVVREGFERAGYQVRGGAISGAAKEELVGQTKIDSRTIASYLYHLEKSRLVRIYDRVKHDVRQLLRALMRKRTYAAPPRVKLEKGTVLILDEAGMIDTRTLERLITQVEKAGATLILAGDTRQLPPILAGGPLARVIDTVGSAYLKENWRQQDPADKKAVSLLRDGEVARALKSYADRGRLHLGEGAKNTIDDLIGVWAKQGGTRRPGQHMIFTQTRAEAREVNHQCQAKRLRSLAMVPGLSIRHGKSRFYIGDRVMFHCPYRIAGIENGYRGTVYAVDPILRNIKVRLDQDPSGSSQTQGRSRYVTIPLQKLGPDDVTLGYAATTHKMQGQTIQHSYVLMGDTMTNLEMAYVQLTRGKQSTRIFVDRETAGEELEDLIQAITRSQAKNLAHDLAKDAATEREKGEAVKSPRRAPAQSHSPDPTLDLGGI